ncbi:MAG: class II glutamine amidotransferase [Oligoflexia bacterium]|nr:class II glutamine amidotransferase [Oligoflexia bacterium]
MCELLGMNANVPTDIRFSFKGLVCRGGKTGPHADGWGIAFYDEKGCRTFHDPKPSAHSEIALFLQDHSIKSRMVVSHIRRANRGRVALENTHPFSRELWGRQWTFAHNGLLRGIKKFPLKFYQPIGTTDSEWAFCWMLDQIRSKWKDTPPPLQLARVIAKLSARLRKLGIFNLLMSDGRCLYCFCSTDLAWITRKAPFGSATLIDEDVTVDFSKETEPRDVVSIVATRPLTSNENWNVLKHGELAAFKNGKLTYSIPTD